MTNLSNILSYLLTENLGLDEEFLEIANYPEGFDIEELKSKRTFAEKARYLAKFRLRKLGKGSGRAVFKADKNTVIKVAMNDKGIAQNKIEIKISQDTPDDAPIAKVKDYDPDGIWIESEKARKANVEDFENIIGSLHHPSKGMHFWQSIPYIYNVIKIARKYNMSYGDLSKTNSWGVINRNGTDLLVLVDYGLDMDVWKQHYAKA